MVFYVCFLSTKCGGGGGGGVGGGERKHDQAVLFYVIKNLCLPWSFIFDLFVFNS